MFCPFFLSMKYVGNQSRNVFLSFNSLGVLRTSHVSVSQEQLADEEEEDEDEDDDEEEEEEQPRVPDNEEAWLNVGFLSSIWSFITTFFASLIPEALPNALN